MEKVGIKSDFIKLGQFLKLSNIISSGGEVKNFLLTSEIFVNNEKENRRGKKLFPGDIVKVKGQIYKVVFDGEKL